ncbi:adenosinetriphosphatase [Fusarium flagelliforme]|uniref:Adenosinetriphosphatase n=1 Tax=Fusarium flagelliforme TaxID=2675880 RepID=A0A395MSJ7_9HYPO|nr:adenosinetriphosphatase [Fusarium flagelliforme]
MVTKLKKPQGTGTTLGKIISAKEEDSNFALPVPAEDDAESTERKANKFSEHKRKADGASNFRLRVVLMGQLSDKARRASGWPLLSPTTIQIRKTDGTRLVLPLSIGKDDCEALRLLDQIQVFLVVEIMHEGKSRDIPWVPCPSVGPYDNFECALRPDNWSKLMEANNTRDIIQQYQMRKGDEGFHRELAAQQQYLNELSQTDPSERIDWPRPVIPQPHDVLNYCFEQRFNERIALKDYMKAATEPKLLPIFGLLLFAPTGAHDQTRTGRFAIGFPEPAAGDHPVLGGYSADDLFRAIVLMYVLMEQRMRPEAQTFALMPRPENRGVWMGYVQRRMKPRYLNEQSSSIQGETQVCIIRLFKCGYERFLMAAGYGLSDHSTPERIATAHHRACYRTFASGAKHKRQALLTKALLIDESPPELRFRAVLSTSEHMTIPLKLSCSHIFDMIRTLRPVEAAPYDRFLLGEGPPLRINLDRDMLRIFDNAVPRYRSNDGYRAAIPVRRILSYIHNMPTVVFRTTSNPGDPNLKGDPNNAIHPFHPNNPIDPDDDDFLDGLYGDDHLSAFRPAPTFVRVPPFARHLDIDHLPRLEESNLVAPVAKKAQ